MDATHHQPDETSIKPVSSLRSHFENFQTKQPTASPSSRPLSAAPSVPVQLTPTTKPPVLKPAPPPTRSSKSPSPNRTASSSNNGPDHRDTSSALSKPTLPKNSEPFRLEKSPAPHHGPQASTLQVSVTAPTSPPKHVPSSTSSAVSRSLRPQSAIEDHGSVQLGNGHFRIPSRVMKPPQSQLAQPQPSVDAVATAAETQNLDGAIPEKKERPKSIPPPINRGSKPGIGNSALVLPAHSRNASSVSIDPNERTSPFATPPSSNEGSPEKENPPPVPHHLRPKQALSSTPPILGFEPPPTHHTISGRRRDRDVAPYTDSRSSMESAHWTRPSRDEADTPEARPGLPPRREAVAPRPISSHQIPQRSTDQRLRTSALSQGFAPKTGQLRTNFPASSSEVALQSAPPRPSRNELVRAETPSMLSPSSARPYKPSASRTLSSEDLKSWQSSSSSSSASLTMPDCSHSNRRAPHFAEGPKYIATGYDLRVMDSCGEYVCVSGAMTRVWSVLTGKLIYNLAHAESTGIRITAVKFKPSTKTNNEDARLWIGSNWGGIQEIDIESKRVVAENSLAHSRRQILKFYRQGTTLWSLDDEGKLFMWPSGSNGPPNLENGKGLLQISRGHTASVMVNEKLWVATGKEINVYSLSPKDSERPLLTAKSLFQSGTGEAVSATSLLQRGSHRVYFGHGDGKVSVYSESDFSCIQVIHASSHKIGCLAVVNEQLWAGDSNGHMYVFDTLSTPWKLKKEWEAHTTPIVGLVADKDGMWKLGTYCVLSLGVNNTIGIWDAMLEVDWLDGNMRGQQANFCTFHEISALVLTWNVGASKPSDLRHRSQDAAFFENLLRFQPSPDIVIFGLQELVDLEDKSLTAKSFFKSKSKSNDGHEHLSRSYRAWRDHLTRCLDMYAEDSEPFSLLHTSSLVGLFLCIFVRDSLRHRISDTQAAEVKTGMGGLHGNKGALIVRFLLDDSSLCFANCHLAAGQTQTLNRNHDVATILNDGHLPVTKRASVSATFSGGGDGSMMIDHEICVVNGDLNYRIDAMTRDTVIQAINTNNYSKLLERDQLLLSSRKNPAFQLRAFTEMPILFAPTYKYDVGTDTYDSGEKRRVPAWCDRILYHGGSFVKQIEYRRHEVRVSDHRPVSARFKFRVKTIDEEARRKCLAQAQAQFKRHRDQIFRDAGLSHLTQVFGFTPGQAQQALDSR